MVEALEPRIVLDASVQPQVNFPLVTAYETGDPAGLISLDVNANATGGAPLAFGDNSINALSGLPEVRSVDLASEGYGSLQAHSRSFSGLNNTGSNGNGWVVANQPYLVVYSTDSTGDRVALIESGQASLLFSVTAGANETGSWSSQNHAGATLSYDDVTGLWTLASALGDQLTFYDLPRDTGDLSADPADGYAGQGTYGKLKTFTTRGGIVTQYTYDANWQLERIERSDAEGGTMGTHTNSTAWQIGRFRQWLKCVSWGVIGS